MASSVTSGEVPLFANYITVTQDVIQDDSCSSSHDLRSHLELLRDVFLELEVRNAW